MYTCCILPSYSFSTSFIVRVILHFPSKLYREPTLITKTRLGPPWNKIYTHLFCWLLIHAMACSYVLSSVIRPVTKFLSKMSHEAFNTTLNVEH